MLAVLFALGVSLSILYIAVVIIWKSTPEMPPLEYFFGFKKLEVDYGDLQKSSIFYKIISRKITFEPNGRRLESAEYILRDKTTRWSKFYLFVRIVNGDVSYISVNSWESSTPESKLRCVITYCKSPEELDLFYKERCVQKVIDQIQYRPLDLTKV